MLMTTMSTVSIPSFLSSSLLACCPDKGLEVVWEQCVFQGFSDNLTTFFERKNAVLSPTEGTSLCRYIFNSNYTCILRHTCVILYIFYLSISVFLSALLSTIPAQDPEVVLASGVCLSLAIPS